MVSAIGLIRVAGNAELNRQQEAQEASQRAHENNNRPVLQGLAKHVMEHWQDAVTAKNAVLPRLKRAHNARLGEYDNSKLASIREYGGSEEYARVTANKCRVVESWLRDVYIGQTEKPWSLSPTPKPDFPVEARQQVEQAIAKEVAATYAQSGQMPDPESIRASRARYMDAVEERLQEEARISTRRMEDKMADQHAQGNFVSAMGDFLSDLTVYPSAIMKGPIVRKRRTLQWRSEGADMAPHVAEDIVLEWERVDPFRAFPAPGASDPQDGYFIQHHTFSRTDLYEMIGAPGFDEEAIRAVLRENSEGRLHGWLGWMEVHDHDRNEDDAPYSLERKTHGIDVLEYHGPVDGKDLIEWGVEDVEDPEATYESCVWLVGGWVIKAQLNYDPLGIRPFYKSSYESLPGEFWGFGVPDVLADIQNVVNAAVRALVNNMGFASGPQIGVNVDRIAAGEDLTEMHPLRIWQLTDSQFQGATDKPIQFFQPQSNATELMSVIEKFYQFADDFSLVPRYMAGSSPQGGAGRTASGLSMLMNAANKGLKGVVSGIDVTVIKPMLEKHYAHNMIYADDPTIKGDAQVVARGAVSLMQMETLQLRRNEFLNVTNNPVDSQIVGLQGRSEVLRAVARDLELDVNRIVPNRERIDQMAQPAPQSQPGQGGASPGQAGSGETLQNGAAVTDNMSPSSMVS